MDSKTEQSNNLEPWETIECLECGAIYFLVYGPIDCKCEKEINRADELFRIHLGERNAITK